jgi:hypothetical protein
VFAATNAIILGTRMEVKETIKRQRDETYGLAEIHTPPSFHTGSITHIRRCNNVKADHLASWAAPGL